MPGARRLLKTIVLLVMTAALCSAQDFKKQVIYQIVTDRFFDGDTSNNNPSQSAGLFDATKTNWHLYWGGDLVALWATTAAFGYRMSAPAVIVGLGSGMFITRRTAPLGGAGIITLALVPTLWYGSGVPLAAAALGVLFYRLLTMWVPVLPGLIALPALRAVGARANVGPGDGVRVTRRAPALQH